MDVGTGRSPNPGVLNLFCITYPFESLIYALDVLPIKMHMHVFTHTHAHTQFCPSMDLGQEPLNCSPSLLY